MATTASKPPTSELGDTLPSSGLPTWGILGRSAFMDDREWVDEFRWPTSVETVDRMRHDSQISALERGTFLPITRYAWGIDPNGADDSMVEQACRDWGLQRIDDAIEERRTGRSSVPFGRARNRFSFAKHQAEAFRAPRYGHAFFEQVGYIGDDGLWHPRKLAARPQWTISQIATATDGGLISIKQQVGLNATEIPVDRLVAYVWDQEPGSWVGTSIYRSCYREWLIKDRLLRVDARNHEKGGGMWYGINAKDATPAEKQQVAQAAADMNALTGPVPSLPNGAELKFERPGAGVSAVDSINRHDEAMARAWLLMVIQLGSTQSGARAVGDNFDRLWGYAQEAIAIWFRDVFNEHVLEDWADWNWGATEAYVPRLVFVRPESFEPTAALDAAAASDPILGTAVDQVKTALAAGELDALLNDHGWQPTQRGRADRIRRSVAAVSLPERQLRRQPYEHEVHAQVDFAALDRAWQTELDTLISTWSTVRMSQVSELRAQIEDAGGDLERLAAVKASSLGADVLGPVLARAATQGAQDAVAEAKRQGILEATVPTLDEASLTARSGATAELLARSLSEAAGRKAVQLSGGALTASDVADEVATHLDQLSDAYLRDQFGGAITAAQNSGRIAAMTVLKPSRIYASELLDANCCAPCIAEDGREFATLEEAARAYPTGGFKGCQGGPRCRGTLVAVYGEAPPTSAFDEARFAALVAAEVGRVQAHLGRAVAELAAEHADRDAETRRMLGRLGDMFRGRGDAAAADALARTDRTRAELSDFATATGRRLEQLSTALAEAPAATSAAVGSLQAELAEIRAALTDRADVTALSNEIEAIGSRIGDLAAVVAASTVARPQQIDVHPPAPRPRGATARRGPDGEVEITYHEGD